MNKAKEIYRASVAFNVDDITLEPVKGLAVEVNEMPVLLEKIKLALKEYGCSPSPKDTDGSDGAEQTYLTGEKSISWILEDTSRGLCCDGSKPQIVCETDLDTGVTTCWAECPD